MKTILAIVSAIALSITSVHAAYIGGVEFGAGQVTITGNVFFNTTPIDPQVAIPDQNLISQGIGQVTEIRGAEGVLWSAATASKEFNFLFDNIKLDSIVGPFLTDTFLYGNILGDVSFYSNTIGTFAPTGVFATDTASIILGDLLLGGVGHAVNDYTVTGSTDADSNAGTGQLDILTGLAYAVIVQDTLARTDGSLADMTFNFSADDTNTNGYVWGGSADFSTTTVAEPSIAMLMGAGMLGMGFVSTRRRKDEKSI